MPHVRCAVLAENRLGEGPSWDGAHKIWWFDIKNRKLCWHVPGQGAGVFDLPVRASVAAPRRDGTLLVAAENGLSVFDPATGELALVESAPPFPEGFRSNDGSRDLAGRFWWSSMDDNGGERPGSVFCFSPTGNGLAIEGVHICNSLAPSPDGRILYQSDSKLGTIYAHVMDPATGALSNRRIFAKPEGGDPDGAASDDEGGLWVAIWGGWRVERYTPDGKVDQVIEVPVEQPSACAFGGEDLSTLFITSARDGLSDEALSDQPMAGSLFAVEPGVRGLRLPPVFY